MHLPSKLRTSPESTRATQSEPNYHYNESVTSYKTPHPLCHSERSGTTVQRRTHKSTIAAESNPEGAPAGGISALVYGIIAEHLIAHKSGAKPRHAKNLHLPSKLRTSPTSTRTNLSEPNFLPAKAGALGGSSRREREVWRERAPSFKRVLSPSKVFFPSLSKVFPFPKNTNFSAKSLDESGFICYHKRNRKKLSGNSVTFRPFCRLYG